MFSKLRAATGTRFWWQTAATVLVGILHGSITLLLPLSLGIYYELVFSTGAAKGRILQQLGIPHMSLHTYATVFTLLLALKFTFSWLEKYHNQRLTKSLGLLIREKQFEHYLFQKHDTGKTLSNNGKIFRLANDPRSLEQFFSKGIISGTRDILLLLGCFILLFSIDISLANYLLASFLLFISFQFFQSGHLKIAFRQYRRLRSDLFRFAGKSLSNQQVISALHRESIEVKRYRKQRMMVELRSRNYLLQNSFQQAVFPVLVYICVGGLMWIIATHADYSQLTAPELFSYIILVLMLLPTWRRIGQLPRLLAQAQASWEKISPLLSSVSAKAASTGKAIADPAIPLYGRNLYEAIAPYKNEKIKATILRYLDQLMSENKFAGQVLKQKPGMYVNNSSIYEQRCVVLVRALLQKAGSLEIPDTFWEGISEPERKKLADFLSKTKRLQTDEQRQLN